MNLLKAPKDVSLSIFSVRQAQLPKQEKERLKNHGIVVGAKLFILENIDSGLIIRTDGAILAMGREFAERIQVFENLA